MHAHLEQWEVRLEERLAHRGIEHIEERSLRTDTDVESRVRVRARLRVARGRRGDAEVGRSVEVHEHARGGHAAEG